jgi:hypothetical protein
MVRAAETMQLYPVPRGEPVVEGLRSDFVALDRMMLALAREQFTGYLRVHDEDLNGVVLLSDGDVIGALFDIAPAVATGQRALSLVASVVLKGDGVVDLFSLDDDMLLAIYQLVSAPTIYDRLYSRFIDVGGLVSYLSEEGINGSIIASNGDERGIMLVHDGVLLTAYTSRHFEPESAEGIMRELLENPTTEIEVRGGPLPEELETLDLEAALTASPMDRQALLATMSQPGPASSIPQRVSEADERAEWNDRLIRMLDVVEEALGENASEVARLLRDTTFDLAAVRNTIDEIESMRITAVPQEKMSTLAGELRGIAAG